MKNAKHTPGPWRVGDAGHAVFGPPGSGMYPNAPITIVQRVVNKANARLIAAAPDLLDALDALTHEVYRLSGGALSPKTEPLMVKALAAVRKAKGGEQ